MLLNPFDDENVEEHFRFVDVGQIEALSERGRQTIATCGLDRTSLLEGRRAVARHVKDLIQDISRNNLTRQEEEEKLKYLYDLASPQSPHSSVARRFIKDNLDFPWTELAVFATRLS